MRSLHSGMLRSWRTSDLAMHRLYQRKMEEKETRSLTESLQRRTHMCMIRVFKGGEKMVKVVGGLLCGSGTRECRRKLPRGLERALHTTSHHHIDFNPHHISNHHLHHNTLSTHPIFCNGSQANYRGTPPNWNSWTLDEWS